MGEPVYDEDVVNLGYLKKVIEETEENLQIPENISKNYATQPNPPYYVGDTWIDGTIVYTCINTRLIGSYAESDWVTESGAKEEAESKNKVYFTQPTNYKVGDMWILQSDEDHKAGFKGQILVATQNRVEYNENDWVNQLSYGSIASINEVVNNLNDAINRIGTVEEIIEDGIIITFYQNTVPEAKHIGDLWYVTETVENYVKGKLYRYDGAEWQLLDDPEIQEAFKEANEARLVADGKIQSFYTTTEPTENIGIGDLWIDTDDNNKLYRYNGTNWVSVYDTRIDELIQTTETTSQTVTELQTDLGEITARVATVETTTITTTDELNNLKEVVETNSTNISELRTDTDSISATVSETVSKLNNDYLTAEQIEAENTTIKEDLDIIKQQQASMELTSTGLQVQIDTINNEGVKTVKNTLVDISEAGVSVSKGEEFKSLLDDTGVHLTAYDKLIAEYTKDGASMYNLTVQNEAIIGNLRCLSVEVDGKKRTHIHWIGG